MSLFLMHLIGWTILQPWCHLLGKFDNQLKFRSMMRWQWLWQIVHTAAIEASPLVHSLAGTVLRGTKNVVGLCTLVPRATNTL